MARAVQLWRDDAPPAPMLATPCALESVNLGNASLRIAVTARSGDEVRVRATLTLVLASLESRRSVPIPAAMRERMARDLVGVAAG